jgi:putative ABC transport system ATP-binding protein
LVTEPAVILADEPTGNLDSSSTADVLALLEQLNREGSTVVLITHEHDIAMRAARVVVIRDGRVATPGDPSAPTDLAGATR